MVNVCVVSVVLVIIDWLNICFVMLLVMVCVVNGFVKILVYVLVDGCDVFLGLI